ncbi:flavodoxin [Patescibacteria group bacterium]|nr:flavodoxin [Patescibacteria group bacterium]
MKILVVYYSWSGKTELVASSICKVLNADLKKIEEVKKRRRFFVYISGGYSAIKGKCSRIKPLNFNLNSYDLIFLGTPVWASRPSPAVNAFISNSNFNGKKVVLFVVMDSSGSENAIKIMRNKIKAKEGKIIASFEVKTGRISDEDVIKRGEEIGKEFLARKDKD